VVILQRVRDIKTVIKQFFLVNNFSLGSKRTAHKY